MHKYNTTVCHCDDDRYCAECLLQQRIDNLTPNEPLIQEMRAWALDCEWGESAEEIAKMSDRAILNGVQNHYDGGLLGFIKDSL